MNKFQICVLFSIICSMVSAGGMVYSPVTDAEFYVKCLEPLTAYSIYLSTASTLIQTSAYNLRSCGYMMTSSGRSTCETTNGLATLDVSIQKFYTACWIPLQDRLMSTCFKPDSCASESDKCSLCLNGTTCNSFASNTSPSGILFDTLTSTLGCPGVAANCPATMTPTLYSACKHHFQDECAQNWFKANLSDPCVDLAFCQMGSYGSIISVSIIALLTFIIL